MSSRVGNAPVVETDPAKLSGHYALLIIDIGKLHILRNE